VTIKRADGILNTKQRKIKKFSSSQASEIEMKKRKRMLFDGVRD